MSDADPRCLEVVTGLEAADPEVRREAVRRAAELLRERPTGPDADRLVGRLAAAAADGQWQVRHAVAVVLSRVLDPRLDPAVMQLCRDDNGRVCRVASDALAARGRDRRVQRREEQEIEALVARLASLGRRAPIVAREAREVAYDLFASIASRTRHDIESPIGKVRTLLARPPADPHDWLRWRDEVIRHVDTIQRIVQSMRHESSDPAVTELERKSARRLVEEALRDACCPTGVAVETQIDVPPGLEVEVPVPELRRALQNLIENAFEALEQKRTGHVVVRVERLRGEKTAFHVQDDGCGIQPEAVELVKIPGYSTKGGGRGYGLTNVESLVERAIGGTLELRSQTGQGTTVTLVIPPPRAKEEPWAASR